MISLSTFFIVLVLILAAVYVLNFLWPTAPSALRAIINVVAVLLVIFLTLALFKVVPLPFPLK